MELFIILGKCDSDTQSKNPSYISEYNYITNDFYLHGMHNS